jgi:N-acetyl-gamma-glutamyl-phosphate reductase
VPEIEFFAGLSRRPIFIPSVGHFRQGMLVSVPLYLDDLPGRPTGADLQEALRAFYEVSEHVTVATVNGTDKLEPEALNETNRLDLYVCTNEARRQAVLIAQLDNLGKGASGAAVQNLRLMLDLDSGA